MSFNDILDTFGEKAPRPQRTGYPAELHDLLETMFMTPVPTTSESRTTLTDTFRHASAYIIANAGGAHNDYAGTFLGIALIFDKHPSLRRAAADTAGKLYLMIDAPRPQVTRAAAGVLLRMLKDEDAETRRAAAVGLIPVGPELGRRDDFVARDQAAKLRAALARETDEEVKSYLSQAVKAMEKASYAPLRAADEKLKSAPPPKM